MYKGLIFGLVILFMAIFTKPVSAIYNPLSEANNVFGIHVLDENDFEDADNLVNSAGGDWGYVTLVIREDEMDVVRWQKAFDRLRDLHLIPIVRIATSMNGTSWDKPTEEDAQKWADFLGSLNWVVENRYVCLFNEPNHDKEWGGKSSPEEYTRVVKEFRNKLKNKSNDFFILPAGFDVAANNSNTTWDAYDYWEEMARIDPTIFSLFDGWNSHSYPNPGFSGEVSDTSRRGIKSYLQEVNFLESLGLKQDSPVFITETGWVHKEGFVENSSLLSSQEVAENMAKSYTSIWKDSNIVAVTPFILNYLRPPFDHFSWKATDGSFYPQYEKVKSLPKKSGTPRQHHEAEITQDSIPEELFTDSEYTLFAKVKNTGQSIWDTSDKLLVDANIIVGQKSASLPMKVLPGETVEVGYTIKTPPVVEIISVSLEMEVNGNKINKVQQEVTLIPPSTLVTLPKLAFKRVADASDYKLLVYEGVRFIKEFADLKTINGSLIIKEIHDLVPGRLYRFVLVKPAYLPVQTFARLDELQTSLEFPPLLPIDFDHDGAFTQRDFIKFLLKPMSSLELFVPW